MPNVVLIALAIQGAPADLRAFQDAALVADGDAWGPSCSPTPVSRTQGPVFWTDRKGGACDAGWTSTSPTSAVLSFFIAWEPGRPLLDAIGVLAQAHNVAVTHGAAIEEFFDGYVSQIWAGEGLQMRRVPQHTAKDDALLGSAHRPVVRHGVMTALARMDRTLAAAA